MTFVVPPCGSTENDPNDWYLEKDGRQYVDEPVLAADEVRALWDQCVVDGTDPMTALQQATEDRLAENQKRRRDAKAKCFHECPMRTMCLEKGFGDGSRIETYGIWGGYDGSELRSMQRELRKRRKRVRG